MRSSKSRSRGNNKNRSVRPTGGNIINRVFDSSGPDGKVRGTPQQIIEKYTQLHRDAQLSNDRVNAENFAQHAEHYTRLLAEAMREVDRAREEQEQFSRERQAERDQQVARNSDRQLTDRERQSERDRERAARLRVQEDASGDPALMDQPYMTDAVFVPDSGLVETPEEVRRPAGNANANANDYAADAPRPARPPRAEPREVRVDRGPRPERQAEQRGLRPERQDNGPRQSPVAALLAEVQSPAIMAEVRLPLDAQGGADVQDKADRADAPGGADGAPKPIRARKPRPKPQTEGPAEAAE